MAAPLLRIVTYESIDTDGLSPQMSLPDFYRRYVRPKLSGRRLAETIRTYDEPIEAWRRLSDDPPLCEIDYDRHVVPFVERLRECGAARRHLDNGQQRGTPLSPNTVRKHLSALLRVLDSASGGERGSIVRPAKLITRIWREPIAGEAREPEPWTLGELATWLRSLPAAELPASLPVPQPDFWRALLLFSYNTGQRRGAVLAARWDWLDASGKLMTIPAAHYKQRKRDHTFYLNEPALAAARSIRVDDRLFPWPFTAHYLGQCASRLLLAAGFSPQRLREVQARKPLHGIRGTFSTQLHAMGHGELADRMTGHAKSIPMRHYVSARGICGPLEELPQPEADPQLRLF